MFDILGGLAGWGETAPPRASWFPELQQLPGERHFHMHITPSKVWLPSYFLYLIYTQTSVSPALNPVTGDPPPLA